MVELLCMSLVFTGDLGKPTAEEIDDDDDDVPGKTLLPLIECTRQVSTVTNFSTVACLRHETMAKFGFGISTDKFFVLFICQTLESAIGSSGSDERSCCDL